MATVAEVAAHLFVSERRVHELIDAGVIERHGRGGYHLDAVRREYLEHLRNVAAGRKPENGDDLDLARELARLAKEQADAQAMKNAMQRGELIERADVVAGLQTVIAHCRARLLSLPTKAAPVAFGATSPAAVKDKLTELVHEALAELAAIRFVAVSADADHTRHDDGDDRSNGRLGAAAKADGLRMGRPQPPPERRGKRRAG